MDLSILRHSCSHVMAEAVKELWPQVRLGIGPSIEDGFYYDFDTSAALSVNGELSRTIDKQEPFTDEDLANIEQKMREIIAKDEPFVREEVSRGEALRLFKKLKEDYKVSLIQG